MFQIEERDKVALVGPNGAGKSTLLKILAGQESADGGLLRIREGIRVHLFAQHPDIPAGATVRDLLASPLPAPEHLERELKELEAKVADPALYEQPGYEAVLERFGALEQEIKRATTPPAEAFEAPLVQAMGFKGPDLDKPAKKLSGGEKTRLFLARTLGPVRDGDLVVLDEPTNHLDVDTIEWLEEWIETFAGTVIVVAHDRAFLDNVATRVFEVGKGRITTYPGNYTDYVTLRDEKQEAQRREHEKAIAELRKAEATIGQFRHQKRFDGQYASRMKMLERHRAKVDRTPDPVLAKMGFGLSFDAAEKSSNEVIRLQAVAKGYDGRPVLRAVDLELGKGDRLGMIGRNGAGKSTLLGILTGTLAKDGGEIRVAPGVKGTVITQEGEQLDEKRTLHQEVLDVRHTLDDDTVKAVLGRFGFRPEEDMHRKVATLSGGERRRLAILKAVFKPSNLLVLDEPTNHLDLESREIVIRALNTYPGTILVVSHDRFLLDSVTTKTGVLHAGKLDLFPGTFTETRHLHRRPQAKPVVRKDRYLVKKKFTDWKADKRYKFGEEYQFSKAEVQDNHALRNALANGWLAKR